MENNNNNKNSNNINSTNKVKYSRRCCNVRKAQDSSAAPSAAACLCFLLTKLVSRRKLAFDHLNHDQSTTPPAISNQQSVILRFHIIKPVTPLNHSKRFLILSLLL